MFIAARLSAGLSFTCRRKSTVYNGRKRRDLSRPEPAALLAEHLLEEHMTYKVSQVQDGRGNASLDILDEQGASIVKLVYPNSHEALRARALVQDAISKAISINPAQN